MTVPLKLFPFWGSPQRRGQVPESVATGVTGVHGCNFDLASPKAKNHFESSLSTFLLDLKAGLPSHWSAAWRGDETLWAPCFRQDLGSQIMVTVSTGHCFKTWIYQWLLLDSGLWHVWARWVEQRWGRGRRVEPG